MGIGSESTDDRLQSIGLATARPIRWPRRASHPSSMLFVLSIPTGIDETLEPMASVLRSVHAASNRKSTIELHIACLNGKLGFYIECSGQLRSVLLRTLLMLSLVQTETRRR